MDSDVLSSYVSKLASGAWESQIGFAVWRARYTGEILFLKGAVSKRSRWGN